MNKAHRIIWSHTRQTFVVADEHASSRGKRNGTRMLLVAAMGASLLAGAAPAMAGLGPSNCTSGGTRILVDSDSNSATYSVPGDGCLVVTSPTDLTTPNGPIVKADGSFEYIVNNGDISTISGNAVLLKPDSGARIGGLVYNAKYALIQGSTSALRLETTTDLDNSLVVEKIKNAGVIQSTEKGSNALYLRNNVKVGDVTNSGDIKAMAEQSGSGVGSVAVRLEGGAEITGKLVNTIQGDIKANYDTGTAILVTGDSGILGGIENHGDIKGATAIALKGDATRTPELGGIENSWWGTIEGKTHSAILINQALVSGTITNGGEIEGKTSGIEASDSTIEGLIHNKWNGEIIGKTEHGIFLTDSSAAGLKNSFMAMIKGGVDGVHLSDSSLHTFEDDSKVFGNIDNAGIIQGRTGAGIRLESSEIGYIDNSGLIGDSKYSWNRDGVDGIHASNSTIADIGNSGTIRGSNGAGILLDEKTQVTDGIYNKGKITGQAAGIALNDSTTRAISNNEGTIESSQGAAISLENGASLSGLGDDAPPHSGFSIINYLGKISGKIAGIALNNSTSTDIVNAGDIESWDGAAIKLENGARITGAEVESDGNTMSIAILNAPALENSRSEISGRYAGISLDNSSIEGSIINNGAIESSQGAAIRLDAASTLTGDIVNLQEADINAPALENSRSEISGRYAGISLDNSSIEGSIINIGAIESSQGSAIRLNAASTLTGDIVNLPGGDISGKEAGISLDNASGIAGDIVNAGKIKSSQGSAIRLDNASALTGDILNDGKIFSRKAGISLDDGSTISGAIANTGKIESSRGSAISLKGGSGITGTTIAGTGLDEQENEIEIEIEGVAIYNDGKIVGDKSGIRVVASTLGGDILNAGLIKGDEGAAIRLDEASTLTGNILNDGKIFSRKAGISLDDGSAINGAIVNTGKIESSRRSAIHLTNSEVTGADITLFDSDDQEVSFENVAIYNSGKIDGDKSGIRLVASTLGGDILNEGLIKGEEGSAIRLKDSTVGAIENDGVIVSEERSGISASGSTLASITNYLDGMIFGRKSAIALSGTGEGGVTVAGDITNDGTLKSRRDAAISLSDAKVGGDIINAGTIKSRKGTGVELTNTQVTGKLLNSGTIEGKRYAIKVDGDSTLSAIEISGTEARLDGDVKARNTDVTLVSGAEFSNEHAYDVQKFTIEQGATLFMGKGRALSWHGTDGITVAEGFHNRGLLDLGSEKERVVNSTITGDYAQYKDAILRVYVDTDKVVAGEGDAPNDYSSAYSKLNVTGTATLARNANIEVDVSDSNYAFTTNRLAGILTAGGITANGFNVTDNSYLFNFGAELVEGVNERDQVDLTIFAIGNHAIEQSTIARNNKPGRNAARVFDQVLAESEVGAHATGKLAGKFIGLTSQQQVSDAVSQSLPLLTGGSQAAIRGAMAGTNRVIQARLDGNSGLSSGDSALTDGNLWIKPFGSRIDQGDRKGVSGYEADVLGFAIGADAPVSETTRLGIAVAYANASIDSNSRIAPQSADVDSLQLIGYGSYKLSDSTELNFQADIGQNSTDGRRHIPFASSTAKSSYDSITAHVGVGLGHTLSVSDTLTFVPSVRADYTWIEDKAYREKGADVLNLHVDKRNTDELILSADGKLNYALSPATVLSAKLGIGYDLLNETTQITAAYAGASGLAFTTDGLDASPWMARGGLGLTHSLDNGTELGLHYDVESRSSFDNQSASLKVRYNF